VVHWELKLFGGNSFGQAARYYQIALDEAKEGLPGTWRWSSMPIISVIVSHAHFLIGGMVRQSDETIISQPLMQVTVAAWVFVAAWVCAAWARSLPDFVGPRACCSNTCKHAVPTICYKPDVSNMHISLCLELFVLQPICLFDQTEDNLLRLARAVHAISVTAPELAEVWNAAPKQRRSDVLQISPSIDVPDIIPQWHPSYLKHDVSRVPGKCWPHSIKLP